MDEFIVRAFWEGELVQDEVTFTHDCENTAWARYDSCVSFYRRSDSFDGGITVQLIQGDEVLAETFVN